MDSSHKITPIALAIICTLYGGNAAAQQEIEQDHKETEQSEPEVVVVTGTALTVDRLELEQAPKDNPSLSQVLKHEPRVGINDAQGSMQGGDLKPEEISLSGARPHQTKYTIGGVGVNNSTTFGNASEHPTALTSGHTSGYFVDTNLIDSVEVLDHNISAEHGGFTGGIINAELRKPTEDFVIDYNFRINDSDWNEPQKVGENFQDSYGTPIDGSGEYQPNFQKRMHALHLGGAISNTQKLALNISHQISEIPLDNRKDVDQTMDNIFLTHIWQSGLWQTTTDFRFADHKSNSFMNDHNSGDAVQEYSESVNSHSGYGATFKVDRMLQNSHWQSSLSYDHLSDEREAESDYFVVFMKRINGTFEFQNQGSYGVLKQTQSSYQFKSALYFDPFVTDSIEYQPSLGVELSHQQGTVNRPNDLTVYQHLEIVPGHPRISSLSRYDGANYDADAQQYSLFADSKMQWDRWGVYLGGRLDHMSVFDQTVFSPRFTTSWDFNLVDTNRITLGVNRYYSANLLGWALKAEQKKYQSNYRNCTANDGSWSNLDPSNLTCTRTTNFDSLSLNQADIPYSDELSASWAIDLNNFAFNTVYIYRQQRDGASYSVDSDTGTATIHNNIKSDDQIVSLEVSTIHPYEFAGGSFSANWKVAYDHRKGHGDLKAKFDQGNDLDGGFQDEWVMLDGQLVRYGEMDVSGYQSPVKSSLDLNMYWVGTGLVWNNRVKYQQGKKATTFQGMETVEINGQRESVNSLASTELDDIVTWDMAVNWTPSQLGSHVILGLSVTNVLDTQEVISLSGIQLGNNIPNEYYNKGRQVWLNVNVRN
ncbi:TonB-dependent receptor plug domain-containing protein [Vibrio kasasachensis]|uniref:TonB-dependent receptor plug domain-containing protein n=1 Tax=Vibrio kasasachensis TaxID=2910248 RepID=UPI003D0F2320